MLGDKQIAKRRNENFFRISATQLVSLLTVDQNPTTSAETGEEESKESIFSLIGAGGAAADTQQPSDTGAVNTVSESQIGIVAESKFLIVDLRDRSDYQAWHIKESYSMPLMMVN